MVKLINFCNRISRLIIVVLLCQTLTFSLFAQNNQENFQSERADIYKNKYKVSNLYETITDNYGEKCPQVYGTRNMRVVLYGIIYRGGANNVYNKFNKRDNENPLPDEGLENLLKEGFSTAIYLYKTNFSKTKKIIGPDSNGKTLTYIQNSLSNEKEVRQLLELVYENMFDSTSGPIYIHCWNGWHQSGYASALILMQFCGLNNEEAVSYWEKCASGNLTKYNHIKNAILKFRPYPDLKIDTQIKNSICPCLN
ncbi:MAG: hypothetical protein ABFD61_00890 [Chloroherpetonaceae bacterium]